MTTTETAFTSLFDLIGYRPADENESDSPDTERLQREIQFAKYAAAVLGSVEKRSQGDLEKRSVFSTSRMMGFRALDAESRETAIEECVGTLELQTAQLRKAGDNTDTLPQGWEVGYCDLDNGDRVARVLRPITE